MNPLTHDTSVKLSAPLTTHERNAIVKRLSQIAVALGHPTWTAPQAAALTREKAELEQKLAVDAALQQRLHSLIKKAPRGIRN